MTATANDFAALVGAVGTRKIVVTQALTVQHAYPSLPAVYATPQMIMLMEIAAAEAIAKLLPKGWGSVGSRVDVEHLAATPVGATVTARAEVIAVNGRRVRFACSAHDGHETIGRGWHERGVVELSRFIKRTAAAHQKS